MSLLRLNAPQWISAGPICSFLGSGRGLLVSTGILTPSGLILYWRTFACPSFPTDKLTVWHPKTVFHFFYGRTSGIITCTQWDAFPCSPFLVSDLSVLAISLLLHNGWVSPYGDGVSDLCELIIKEAYCRTQAFECFRSFSETSPLRNQSRTFAAISRASSGSLLGIKVPFK